MNWNHVIAAIIIAAVMLPTLYVLNRILSRWSGLDRAEKPEKDNYKEVR